MRVYLRMEENVAVELEAVAAERGLRVERVTRAPGAPGMAQAAHDGIARARALQEEGLTVRQIAARLNAEGVPTARAGGKWWASTVQKALRVKD